MRPVQRACLNALLIVTGVLAAGMRIFDSFDPSAFIVQHALADVRGVVHRHVLP